VCALKIVHLLQCKNTFSLAKFFWEKVTTKHFPGSTFFDVDDECFPHTMTEKQKKIIMASNAVDRDV